MSKARIRIPLRSGDVELISEEFEDPDAGSALVGRVTLTSGEETTLEMPRNLFDQLADLGDIVMLVDYEGPEMADHVASPVVYAGLDAYGRCSCDWRCSARSGPECRDILSAHVADIGRTR